MVYCKDVNKDLKHFSYTLISDELSHDKVSVYVFNKALLDVVSKMISFKKVHYWSDGAGSHFKNRFNLASVLYHHFDYGTQSTWSFFETKLSDTTISVAKNSQFLKQDACTELVLLSSFSLKPIVGDSATINNNTRNKQSGRDWKPATEK